MENKKVVRLYVRAFIRFVCVCSYCNVKKEGIMVQLPSFFLFLCYNIYSLYTVTQWSIIGQNYYHSLNYLLLLCVEKPIKCS